MIQPSGGSFLAEPGGEITPADLARYDAIYVNAPRVTPGSFAQGPGRTRLIARHGVGYDSVDVAACNEHGVSAHHPAGRRAGGRWRWRR